MQLMLKRIGFFKYRPKLGPDGSGGFNFKFLGEVGNFQAGGPHDFTGSGFHFPGDNPQLGRFPGTIGPDESNPIAGFDFPGDILENFNSTGINFLDVFESEHKNLNLRSQEDESDAVTRFV